MREHDLTNTLIIFDNLDNFWQFSIFSYTFCIVHIFQHVCFVDASDRVKFRDHNGLGGCYYLWWNPCLLSLTFFLNGWRRPANYLTKLHHPLVPSSLVSRKFHCLQFRGRGAALGTELEVVRGGRKPFSVARGGWGQWPPVPGRRLPPEFLRGGGLGALRAILTQINQTAAVGPGRPEGLRPPKWESQKPGFVSHPPRRCRQLSWQWIPRGGRSGKVGIEWNPFCGSRAHQRFFSFLRRVFCLVSKHWLSEIFAEKNNKKRGGRGNKWRIYCWMLVGPTWWDNSLGKTILTLFGNNPRFFATCTWNFVLEINVHLISYLL